MVTTRPGAAPRTQVVADLHVDLLLDGEQVARTHLTGRGGALRMQVDDPAVFAGSRDAGMVRGLAEVMAGRGLVVHVMHEETHLVSLGAVSAPWWQRRATGSRRIRIGSWRGAWTGLRSRGRAPVLPSGALSPPSTPWPPVPTASGARRSPTTTHDPARGGAARLVLSRQDSWDGERQPVFWLGEETVIGSDPSCDVVLPDLEPRHAVVRHDDEDEYVVDALATAGAAPTTVHGLPARGSLLRTGARLDVGPYHLVFFREEYADHGRPYGGRVGGEAGEQQAQPRRPGGSSRGEWSR